MVRRNHKAALILHRTARCSGQRAPGCSLLVLVVAYVLFVCYIVGFLFALLLLYLSALLAFFAVLPCVWVLDQAAGFFAWVMRRTGAVRLLLIIALAFLVSGFIIDLATS
jgi:hypothetical protein